MDAQSQTTQVLEQRNAGYGRVEVYSQPGEPGWHSPSQTPSRQEPVRFTWDLKRQRAADLLTDPRYSESDVCDLSGLRREELRWCLMQKDFNDVVDAMLQELRRRVMNTGVAVREFRVACQNERHRGLRQVVAERAASADPGSRFYDPDADNVPGVETGLMVKTLKTLGSGPNATIVPEWSVDRGLLSAFKEIEEHVGKETGQLVEKRQVEVNQKMYIGVNIDDV